MAINISNIEVTGGDVGVSVGHGSHVNLDGYKATGTRVALEVRDPPSLLEQLGLPSDTPTQYVYEALEILKNSAGRSEAERVELVRRSRLGACLDTTEKVLSVVVSATSLFFK